MKIWFNLKSHPHLFISLFKNNKQKGIILDAYTRMVFLFYAKIIKKEVNL